MCCSTREPECLTQTPPSSQISIVFCLKLTDTMKFKISYFRTKYSLSSHNLSPQTNNTQIFSSTFHPSLLNLSCHFLPCHYTLTSSFPALLCLLSFPVVLGISSRHRVSSSCRLHPLRGADLSL